MTRSVFGTCEFVLSDGLTRPATVERLRDSAKYTHFEITLTEGETARGGGWSKRWSRTC